MLIKAIIVLIKILSRMSFQYKEGLKYHVIFIKIKDKTNILNAYILFISKLAI